MKWTPEEEAIVRGLAANTPPSKILIQGRSKHAVSLKIRRLGIKRLNRHWTVAEERKLWSYWGTDLSILAQRFDRTEHAIYDKAKKMGLPLGCPEDCEVFSRAARRLGYDREKLTAILKWAGHKRRRRLTYDRSEHHRWIVDTFEVDAAVELWHEHMRTTETIAEAARRLGTGHLQVRAALAASSAELPPKPPRGCHWRVPIAVIDAAWLGRRAA